MSLSSDHVPCTECSDAFFPNYLNAPTWQRLRGRSTVPCSSCLIQQQLPPQAKINPNNVPCSVCHDLLLPDALRFQQQFKELRRSAESCQSCELLLGLAEQAEPDENIREDAAVLVMIEPARKDTASKPSGRVCRDKFVIAVQRNGDIEAKRLDVFSHEPTPWYNIPRRSPDVFTQRDFGAALETASSWVNQCVRDHIFCKMHRSADMPTRILRLEGDDRLPFPTRVRLHVPNGDKARYYALSHCWGEDGRQLRTTTANIDRHLREVPIATLSPVFAQAIMCTWLFGCRYIWIDSLCIVQDDVSDWEREASRMASVYENADMTLAATCCKSGKGSLLHDVETKQLTIGASTIFSRRPIKHLTLRPEREASAFPLLKRAWVYQERLLSRRTLHFGSDELFWECRESIRCECSHFGTDGNASPKEDPLRLLDANIKRKHFERLICGNPAYLLANMWPEPNDLSGPLAVSVPNARPEMLQARWREIVTEYSGLALTFPEDRLAALSGLAKQMRRFRGSRYLAGLWEDSLFRDLLWVPFKLQSNPPPGELIWRAPSWSWASQVGAVYYTNAHAVQFRKIVINITGGSFGVPGDVSSPLEGLSCELLEAECVPVGADDTGRLSSGFIKVSGHIIDDIDPSSCSISTDGCSGKIVIGENSSFRVFFDEQMQQDAQKAAFLSQSLCLLRIGCISFRHEKPWFIEWSLLLRRVEHDDAVFQRCGIVGLDVKDSADIHDSMWYQDVKEKTVITIK